MLGERFTYRVKPDGTILDIEGPWDQFAVQNYGLRLMRSEIMGKNLFNYITNSEIQDIYRSFHFLLERNPERVLSFPYRCDSPGYRRDMNMELSKVEDSIQYVSTIVKLHKYDSDYYVDYGSRSGIIINMCSWCKKIKLADEPQMWYPLEQIFSKVSQSYQISHSICPDCSDSIYVSKNK